MPFDIRQNLRIQYYDTGVSDWVNMECSSYEIDIERGIEIEQNVFARPKVGIATVKLSKASLYDLLNTSGPAYKSNNLFRIQCQLAGGGYLNLFNGVIQNYEMQYNAESKRLDITIVANDFMKIGLNTNITTFTIAGTTARSFKSVMAQLATAINAIDTRWSLSQAGTGGSSTFQTANTFLDISSGELYAQFLDAELGWMWSDRDNLARYMTRNDVDALQALTWAGTSGPTVSNVHSSSADHVCMDYMNLSYKSDEIANIARVTDPTGGIVRTATNTTSVTNFGRQLGEFFIDLDTASGLGSSYMNWATAVANAATPRRLAGVSVPMITDAGEISDIVTKDIGDFLRVEFASTGFTTMQEVTIISSLNHNITPDHWELNIGLWEGI